MVEKQILKLTKLCEHWANHNESHKENFQKWRQVADEIGLDLVVEYLNKAIEMMDKCTEYLLAAKDNLEKI